MDKRFFSAREVLFAEDDTAGKAYIIKDGEVALSKTTRNGFSKEIATLGAGDILGEMSLLTGNPHSVTATAISDGHAFVLEKDELMDRIGKSDKVVAMILTSVVERLRGTY